MKKKAIILVLAAITSLSACKKDLTSLNVDPKNPSTVPSYALFTDAEHALSNTLTSSNVNLNIFRLIEQQWQETTYTDESNYNLNSRLIPDVVWDEFYTVVLVNLEQSKKVIPTDVSDAAQQKNETAIADMLEVYSYYYLLTTYGNIPYSQALDITKPFPKFDDAATVYADLLKRLDADIAALNANSTAASFGSADIIYGGDPGAWIKFGNSFKIKMGMTIADVDGGTTAEGIVEDALKPANGGIMTSNSDNALFAYLGGDPNTNPIWVDLVESGRQDFVACSTLMLKLVAPDSVTVKDPRLPYFFTTNTKGKYAGGDPGANCSFGQNSKPSGPLLDATSIGSITNPTFPGDLMDYAETELNLAEAAARGWSVGGSAESYYIAGVTASIQYWTGSTDGATAYLTANPLPASNLDDQLAAIAMQKWYALYNRGWDAWIEQRRLDVPVLAVPPTAEGPFPVRFSYPINEQDVNVVNYNQASTAIGGDKTSTHLWFDKSGTY